MEVCIGGRLIISREERDIIIVDIAESLRELTPEEEQSIESELREERALVDAKQREEQALLEAKRLAEKPQHDAEVAILAARWKSNQQTNNIHNQLLLVAVVNGLWEHTIGYFSRS